MYSFVSFAATASILVDLDLCLSVSLKIVSCQELKLSSCCIPKGSENIVVALLYEYATKTRPSAALMLLIYYELNPAILELGRRYFY